MSIGLQELIRGDDLVASKALILSKLIRALRDPVNAFGDLADIIESDPALAARLLRIVNSPFYGFSSKIETIEHALSIVGTEQLSELALTTLVRDKFKGIPKELIDMDSFWRRSITCGLAAINIAQHSDKTNPHRFYIPGLLHDIGCLVLYMKLPDLAKTAALQSQATAENLYDVERKLMGFDHAQVGGALLNAWDLPQNFVQAVTFHHDPGAAADPYFVEAAIIHLAEFITNHIQLSGNGDLFPPTLEDTAWKRIGLSLETFTSIFDQTEQQVTDKIQMLTS